MAKRNLILSSCAILLVLVTSCSPFRRIKVINNAVYEDYDYVAKGDCYLMYGKDTILVVEGDQLGDDGLWEMGDNYFHFVEKDLPWHNEKGYGRVIFEDLLMQEIYGQYFVYNAKTKEMFVSDEKDLSELFFQYCDRHNTWVASLMDKVKVESDTFIEVYALDTVFRLPLHPCNKYEFASSSRSGLD